jgi:hypothetical protein
MRTLATGIDSIKLFSSKFKISQYFADHLFKNAQEKGGDYIDKDLHQIKHDFDFLDALDKQMGFKFCYYDQDGVYLPSKKKPYFCHIDIDQVLKAWETNTNPLDASMISGHIRITLSRSNEDPTLKIETELSRLCDPNHFNFALVSSDEDIEKAFRSLEHILNLIGIELDISECRLARVDISEDVQAPYDVHTLEKMINDYKWKKIQRYKGQGGIIHLSNAKNPSKKRQFSFYDKVVKIDEEDIPQLKGLLKDAPNKQTKDLILDRINRLKEISNHQPKDLHHLRRELRFMNAKALKDDLGVCFVRDLYHRGAEICTLAKERISQFISYTDHHYLEINSLIKQSMNEAKGIFAYYGIIGIFGTLKNFEEALLGGKLDFIDCTDKNKRVFISNLRKTERDAINLRFRVSQIGCNDLKTLPTDEYHPHHRFKDEFWDETDDETNDETWHEMGGGHEEISLSEVEIKDDEWGSRGDAIEGSRGDDMDGSQGDDMGDDYIKANATPIPSDTITHHPLRTDDGKILGKTSNDYITALHDSSKIEDQTKSEAYSYNQFRLNNILPQISVLRDALLTKDLTFDQWISQEIMLRDKSIENEPLCIQVDIASTYEFNEGFEEDCLIKWINLQHTLKHRISSSRDTVLNCLDAILCIQPIPKLRDDNDFDCYWDKFWYSLDTPFKELVHLLSMNIEIKNLVKLKAIKRGLL